MLSVKNLVRQLVLFSSLAGCASLFGACSSADEDTDTNSEEMRGECKRDWQCVPPRVKCELCADGSSSCPTARCDKKKRQCVYSFPQCKPYEPCAGKACGDSCKLCSPTNPDCVETQELKYCQKDGSCSSSQPVCSEPPKKVFCGGIAAFPCPGAGSCVDDPSDSCDPLKGGADCGGMCVCNALGFCVDGFHWDSSPSVCGCVPNTVGTKCGNNTCGTGEFCCNESCGICAPEGGGCIELFCG